MIFYHGSSVLFPKFDLSHALEGDGKVKFGYGVYLTSSLRSVFLPSASCTSKLTCTKSRPAISQFKSGAYYSETKSSPATTHYVYTVEVPDLTDDNHIDFKKPVHPEIIKRTEQELGYTIPEKCTLDGKDLRSVFLPTASCTSKLTCTNSRLANGKTFQEIFGKEV